MEQDYERPRQQCIERGQVLIPTLVRKGKFRNILSSSLCFSPSVTRLGLVFLRSTAAQLAEASDTYENLIVLVAVITALTSGRAAIHLLRGLQRRGFFALSGPDANMAPVAPAPPSTTIMIDEGSQVDPIYESMNKRPEARPADRGRGTNDENTYPGRRAPRLERQARLPLKLRAATNEEIGAYFRDHGYGDLPDRDSFVSVECEQLTSDTLPRRRGNQGGRVDFRGILDSSEQVLKDIDLEMSESDVRRGLQRSASLRRFPVSDI